MKLQMSNHPLVVTLSKRYWSQCINQNNSEHETKQVSDKPLAIKYKLFCKLKKRCDFAFKNYTSIKLDGSWDRKWSTAASSKLRGVIFLYLIR